MLVCIRPDSPLVMHISKLVNNFLDESFSGASEIAGDISKAALDTLTNDLQK